MNETQIRQRIKLLSGIVDKCKKRDIERKKHGAKTSVYHTDYMCGQIDGFEQVLNK